MIGPDGRERTGVRFVTDDMITEPLPKDDDPHNVNSWNQFEVFTATVERLRTEPAERARHSYAPELTPGPVVQPCHVRALRSGPWNSVRHCDPWSERPVPDQWELYNLHADPNELTNLVVHERTKPTVVPEGRLRPGLGLTREDVEETTRKLHRELSEKEAELLSPYPSAYPTAGASVGA